MADRPFLKEFGLSAENLRLIVFHIARGQAYFWTKERNLMLKEYIEF